MALLQVPDDARARTADSVRDLERRRGVVRAAGAVRGGARAGLLQPAARLRGGRQADPAALLPRRHAHGCR